MSIGEQSHPATMTASAPRAAKNASLLRGVMACIDGSPTAANVVAHAAAVAEAAGDHLVVARVIEPEASGRVPTDPVEADLRRRDAKAAVAELLREVEGPADVRTTMAEGCAARRLRGLHDELDVDLAVFGRNGENALNEVELGGTVRSCVDTIGGSVMIVPAGSAGAAPGPVRYRRVMAPLDTSALGERALPIAMQIAEAHGAELLLVHAVPHAPLTRWGAPEPEDIEIADRIRARNERVARRYLGHVRSRLDPRRLKFRDLVLNEDDPRRALVGAAAREGVDLVVMSATGHGAHADRALGGTADFLIRGLQTPVLVVRDREDARATTSRFVQSVVRPPRPILS